MKKIIDVHCGDALNDTPTFMYSPKREVENALEVLTYMQHLTTPSDLLNLQKPACTIVYPVVHDNEIHELRIQVKSNHTDFVSTIFYGSQSRGIDVNIYVNGNLSANDLDEAFGYFNEAFDLINEQCPLQDEN